MLEYICTVKSMHQENEYNEVRLAMHALCQSLQRYGALANIALIKLTAKLASKLHYVPCLNFLCEIARGVEIVEKELVGEQKSGGSKLHFVPYSNKIV